MEERPDSGAPPAVCTTLAMRTGETQEYRKSGILEYRQKSSI
ncbi:hypothetical protein D805_1498 [Bifidobacterium thermophilum RBL67]|uniref:Uncharacterized protein n=1 Tax=Bifidobacterium thermophilum RBL67 TaxID=1254439 RepID=M4RE33_9BIFI|nr:hypothetical protein D805_1498 [Bifidobacterium thermophilum RBL67]